MFYISILIFFIKKNLHLKNSIYRFSPYSQLHTTEESRERAREQIGDVTNANAPPSGEEKESKGVKLGLGDFIFYRFEVMCKYPQIQKKILIVELECFLR